MKVVTTNPHKATNLSPHSTGIPVSNTDQKPRSITGTGRVSARNARAVLVGYTPPVYDADVTHTARIARAIREPSGR